MFNLSTIPNPSIHQKMPIEIEKKILNVTWEAYDAYVHQLAKKILESGWEFDMIVAIARGGLPLGTQLSHLLGKKIAVIFASSYKGAGEQTQGDLKISLKIAMLADELGKRVLLVDDLVDTGVTLREVEKTLYKNYQISELRTAALFAKENSAVIPTYYIIKDIAKDCWIYLPYEKKPETTELVRNTENRF